MSAMGVFIDMYKQRDGSFVNWQILVKSKQQNSGTMA